MPPFAARPAGATPTTSTPEERYEFFSRHVSLRRMVASPSLTPCLGGPSSLARAAEHNVASATAVRATASLEPLPKMSMDDFPHVSAIHGRISPVTTRAGRSGAIAACPTVFST